MLGLLSPAYYSDSLVCARRSGPGVDGGACAGGRNASDSCWAKSWSDPFWLDG